MYGTIHDYDTLRKYIFDTLGDDNEFVNGIVAIRDMEDAFLGIAVKPNLKPCLVYDYWAMVDIAMRRKDIEIDEAIDFINEEFVDEEFGEQGPVIMETCRQILR
jgi:hypothetical protein